MDRVVIRVHPASGVTQEDVVTRVTLVLTANLVDQDTRDDLVVRESKVQRVNEAKLDNKVTYSTMHNCK